MCCLPAAHHPRRPGRTWVPAGAQAALKEGGEEQRKPPGSSPRSPPSQPTQPRGCSPTWGGRCRLHNGLGFWRQNPEIPIFCFHLLPGDLGLGTEFRPNSMRRL